MGERGKREALAEKPAGEVSRREKYAVVLVLALAAALRTANLLLLHDSPFFRVPILDEKIYDDWARRIAAGRLLDGAPFFMGPLYAYFLGGLYAAAGHHPIVARIVQMILGLGSAFLSYHVAGRFVGRRVAVVALVLSSLYAAQIYFETVLLMATLAMFLTLLAVWGMLRACASGNRRGFFVAGLLLGVSALARANVLVMGLAFALWLIVVRKPRAGKAFASVGVFVAGMSVVLAVPTSLNYVSSGRLVPISANGGWNFYIGNGREATGGFVYPAGVDAEDDLGGVRFASAAAGKSLDYPEASRFWFRRALSDISNRSGAWVALMLKKIWMYFQHIERPQNENFYFVRRFSPALWLAPFSMRIVMPLGLVGLVLAFSSGRRPLTLLGTVALGHVVAVTAFFVTSRYRLPAFPVWALLASYAAVTLWERSRSRGVASIARLLFLAAAFAVLVNVGYPSFNSTKALAREYAYLGNRLIELRQYGDAASQYRKSLELRPAYDEAERGLGLALFYLGDLDGAERELEKAVRMKPGSSSYWHSLGMVRAHLGREEEAGRAFERALQLDPDNVPALIELGVVRARRGELEGAVELWRRAGRLNPGNERVRAYLEQARKILASPGPGEE